MYSKTRQRYFNLARNIDFSMNYLAHLYLSGSDEELIIGNMAGDFIRQRDVALASTDIQRGIHLHRSIDTFTDGHPIFRQGLVRLRPNHGKYAAVVQDILYDHLLAKFWSRYSNQSLTTFAADKYELFSRRLEDLPGKLKHRIPKMMEHHFIESYADKEKVHYIFTKMDERTKYPSQFYMAMQDYEASQLLFDQEFFTFFNILCDYVFITFKVTLPRI